MQNHQPFTLYRSDGSTVVVKNWYLKPIDRLAEGLITEDGRVVYCRDEQLGLFWFRDTQEELYRDKP